MRLLLDEHLPPPLANQLGRHGIDAAALRDWSFQKKDRFLRRPDHEMLSAALEDGRVVVTCDCRTIPLLLKNWAEQERSHGGVIFVDDRAVSPNDVGGLLRGLLETERRLGSVSWQDPIVFLAKAPQI
ncbi:MAG: DUF5615 family PIN-like protein [Dehalococcoidia bacterium]|nr:DUF5615 family PIN-like protein [Dehalococcoidia bacterium]